MLVVASLFGPCHNRLNPKGPVRRNTCKQRCNLPVSEAHPGAFMSLYAATSVSLCAAPITPTSGTFLAFIRLASIAQKSAAVVVSCAFNAGGAA